MPRSAKDELTPASAAPRNRRATRRPSKDLTRAVRVMMVPPGEEMSQIKAKVAEEELTPEHDEGQPFGGAKALQH